MYERTCTAVKSMLTDLQAKLGTYGACDPVKVEEKPHCLHAASPYGEANEIALVLCPFYQTA
jgi:hypothetical protein